MIGGPTDIVVEPNIVRAAPTREQAAPRGAPASENPPRAAPLPDAPAWAEPESLDAPEPVLPEPHPRPARPSFADEVRRPAPRAPDVAPAMMPDPMIRPENPRTEPRPDFTASRPMSRPEPTMPRPSRVEPPLPPLRPRPSASPPPPAPAANAPVGNAEQNLAEMAQRLEAALRGPGASEPRVGAPPVAPEAPRGRGPDAPSSAPPVSPPTKTGFENLEDEMASLLGRPKTPS